MGIQAHIEVKGLVNANVEIQYESEQVFDYVCPDTGEEVYTDLVNARLTFPCGEEAWMSVAPSGKLWTDFNHWGDNRPHLEPLLRQYGVPFIEGVTP